MRNHVIAKGADVPPTGPSIEREIVLPVPAEEAWELLSDAERLEEWLAPEVDLVPEPGTPLHVRDDDGTERIGVVDAVEPGECLVFRWWPVDDPDRESTVELVLEPAVGGTRLVVVETMRSFGGPTAWGVRLQACAAATRLPTRA